MNDLSTQPPPKRGAEEGYYPDPLGGMRARWWDGSNWTLQVGPVMPPNLPSGKPAPPPVKVCKRCGAHSETFNERCPNCGRSYGMGTGAIIGIVAGACLAAILLLGGCAVLIGLAVDEVDDRVDDKAITKQQFDSVPLGSTEAEVRARLGRPISEDEFRHPRASCIYYPKKGEGLSGFDDFQFCFQHGVLEAKSAD